MTNQVPTFQDIVTAIQNGDASVIEKLHAFLSADPNNLNKSDDNGATLLHYACAMGNESVVRYLLSNNVNNTNPGRDCLGIESTMANNKTSRDITINGVTYKSGSTPLHMAAKSGNMNIVRMLLCAGANPEIRNNASFWDNDLPSELTSNAEIRTLLEDFSSRSAKRSPYDYESLSRSRWADFLNTSDMVHVLWNSASNNDDRARLRNLLNSGACLHTDRLYQQVSRTITFGSETVRVRQMPQTTPMMIALAHPGQWKTGENQVESYASILLDYGARLNGVDQNKKNVIHYIATYNRTDVFDTVCSRVPESFLTQKDDTGLTPLEIALVKKNWDVASALLNHDSVRRSVPQLSLIKDANIMIGHGSYGNIFAYMEAVRAPEPLIERIRKASNTAGQQGVETVVDNNAGIGSPAPEVEPAPVPAPVPAPASAPAELDPAVINARNSFIRAIENNDVQLAFSMLENGEVTLDDVNEIRNSGTLNESSLSICNAVVGSYNDVGIGDVGENVGLRPETPVRNASEGEEETIRAEGGVMALPDTPVTGSAIEMPAPRELDLTQFPVDPISFGEEGGPAPILPHDVPVPEADLTAVLEEAGVRAPVSPDAHQPQGASEGDALDESSEPLREEDSPTTEQSFQPFQLPRQTNTPIRITPVSIDVEPVVSIQPEIASMEVKAPEILPISDQEFILPEESSIPLIIEANLVKREPQIEETNSATPAESVAPTAGEGSTVTPAESVAPTAGEGSTVTPAEPVVSTHPQAPVDPTRPENQSVDSSSQPNGQQNQIQVIRHQYGDLGENDSKMDHSEALAFANERNRSRLDRRRRGRRNRNRPTPYQTAINNIRKMEELGLLPKGPNGESNADVYLYRLYQAREFYHSQEYLMIEGGEYRRVSDLFRSRDGKSLNRVYSNLIARELSDDQLRAYAITILTAERCIDNKGHDRARHRGRILDRYSYRPGAENNIEETHQTIQQKLNSAGEIVPEYTREEITTDRRVAFITNESKMA